MCVDPPFHLDYLGTFKERVSLPLSHCRPYIFSVDRLISFWRGTNISSKLYTHIKLGESLWINAAKRLEFKAQSKSVVFMSTTFTVVICNLRVKSIYVCGMVTGQSEVKPDRLGSSEYSLVWINIRSKDPPTEKTMRLLFVLQCCLARVQGSTDAGLLWGYFGKRRHSTLTSEIAWQIERTIELQMKAGRPKCHSVSECDC